MTTPKAGRYYSQYPRAKGTTPGKWPKEEGNQDHRFHLQVGTRQLLLPALPRAGDVCRRRPPAHPSRLPPPVGPRGHRKRAGPIPLQRTMTEHAGRTRLGLAEAQPGDFVLKSYSFRAQRTGRA